MSVVIDGQEYVPAMHIPVIDMPKLESPFVRGGDNHCVTPQIAEGYEWVFEDDSVLAVEKLDGTCVSVGLQGGRIVDLLNRLQPKGYDTLQTNPYIEGVRITATKDRLPKTAGRHFGELMGPKIQHNFLKLEKPEWYPFEYLKKKFYYKSWGRYPKDFDTISRWFKEDLFSLVYIKYHGEKVRPEGVVFHHTDGRMAKLRCDMFDWWKGERHKEKEKGGEVA